MVVIKRGVVLSSWFESNLEFKGALSPYFLLFLGHNWLKKGNLNQKPNEKLKWIQFAKLKFRDYNKSKLVGSFNPYTSLPF